MLERTHLGLLVMITATILANSQTAEDFAKKYPAVASYQVRPGLLMTAKFAANGQVCDAVLQRRYTPDQKDADSTIPDELEDQLINELVPKAERGPSAGGWLKNSFAAGGVTHKEREFKNVLIEIDGTVSGGDKIIEIHWKKRTCGT